MRLPSPLFLLAILAGCDAGPPPITGRIERETFPSAVVGDDYHLDVRLPPGYDESPAKRYPVAFQLDGTNFGPEFDITAGNASALAAAGAIPEAIVVGVGYPYPNPDPIATPKRGRWRDYVTDEANGKPGGAPAFLQFLVTELIPHIDAKYRTDPARRVLLGHSLGGFVAAWAMLETAPDSPRPFAGFVAADPSTGLDDLRLFSDEAALAARTRSLPVALHFHIARYDGAVQRLYFEALAARLRADFPDLKIQTRVSDTDHGGVLVPSLHDGLAFVLGGVK